MAKNIGLIKISGKVGDLQFFQKEGKTYVGLTSQLSKDRIMKDPAFSRTRENMSEFGGAAAVSKSLRNSLIPLRALIDSGLHSRFVGLIRQTINLGTGARGERRVEFSLNQEELVGFELNKNTKVSETVLTTNTLVANVDRNQLTLDVEEFLPSDYLMFPEGTTHFRMILAGLSISDFEPVGLKKKYRPINTEQHGLFVKESTAELPINTLVAGGLTLTADLPGAPVLDPDVLLAAFLGIQFLQEVNGVYYALAAHNALRIEKVF